MGVGMSTCAEFAERYRQSPTNTELFYYSWAQGFMSAWNLGLFAAKEPNRDLNGWQLGDQQLKLRNFCQENR